MNPMLLWAQAKEQHLGKEECLDIDVCFPQVILDGKELACLETVYHLGPTASTFCFLWLQSYYREIKATKHPYKH